MGGALKRMLDWAVVQTKVCSDDRVLVRTTAQFFALQAHGLQRCVIERQEGARRIEIGTALACLDEIVEGGAQERLGHLSVPFPLWTLVCRVLDDPDIVVSHLFSQRG